jgi:hypothetical protein
MIRDRCRQIYVTMQGIEASGGRRSAAEAVPLIRDVARLAEPSPRTARALEELASFLEIEPVCDRPEEVLHEFASYFGRGMQYLSFIRRSAMLR